MKQNLYNAPIKDREWIIMYIHTLIVIIIIFAQVESWQPYILVICVADNVIAYWHENCKNATGSVGQYGVL